MTSEQLAQRGRIVFETCARINLVSSPTWNPPSASAAKKSWFCRLSAYPCLSTW